MKRIILKSIKLQNFKGIRNASFELNESITKFGGRNESGKTTLFDAFTWLLFGKDSEDKKDFSIKTLDEHNAPIHRLIHEVECILSVNNEDVKLRRVYAESWTTTRGSSEEKLTGHETKFFWKDVPKSAGEYQAIVGQILLESTFKLITNPFYFNSLKMAERRNILISMAGDYTVPEQFSGIMAKIGKMTPEDYKKQLSASKTRIEKELSEIPARIDEAQRGKPGELNWSEIEDEINSLNEKVKVLDDELTDSSKAVQAVLDANKGRIEKINQLRSYISDFDLKVHNKNINFLNDRDNEVRKINNEIEDINRLRAKNADLIELLNLEVTELEGKAAQLRIEFMALNQQSFTGGNDIATVCPTCNQHLPKEMIENKLVDLEKKFNEGKVNGLGDINKRGKSLVEQIAKKKQEIETAKQTNYNELIAQANAKLQEVNSRKLTKDPYPEEYTQAKLQLEELEKATTTSAETTSDLTHLKLKRSGYLDRIQTLNTDLEKRKTIKDTENRINELLGRERTLVQEKADIENLELQVKAMLKHKIDFVESRVNDLFDGVQFKMFEEQLNGGIADTCETLIKGVPWPDANNAGRINAGISIINTLCRHFNVSAPVWIDNAESVNQITSTIGQRIDLYVTDDSSLTIL